MADAVPKDMRPFGSPRFLFGFALAVVGAFMAINIVMEVRPPLLRTAFAAMLFAIGAHMIHDALDRKR